MTEEPVGAAMGERIVEKYELAGVDDRARGFTRLVEILHRETAAFRATFRYEALRVTTGDAETAQEALADVVRSLHGRGYSQLRSRLSFRHETYLGTQEPWVEYPDPDRGGLWRRLTAWLRR